MKEIQPKYGYKLLAEIPFQRNSELTKQGPRGTQRSPGLGQTSNDIGSFSWTVTRIQRPKGQ
jgi:hypothetical protein